MEHLILGVLTGSILTWTILSFWNRIPEAYRKLTKGRGNLYTRILRALIPNMIKQ